MIRIAHFSDTHVLSLKGVGLRKFASKRWTGGINLALNRSKHYRVDIFERLLDAVIAQGCDHNVCTGDLVNLALEPEFVRVREMLDAVFTPETLTLVPGNHDYYCKDAAYSSMFETFFGHYQPHDVALPTDSFGYPILRQNDDYCIVGLSTAIPTPVFMATGSLNDNQLDAMDAAFAQAGDRFRMLLLHHPLFPEPKRRLDQMRRLKEAPAIVQRFDAAGGPQLVVHGHNHEFKRMALPNGNPVIQVGSASRSGTRHRAEFNVYCIEAGALVAIERHIHDPSTGAFVPCDEAGNPLSAAA